MKREKKRNSGCDEFSDAKVRDLEVKCERMGTAIERTSLCTVFSFSALLLLTSHCRISQGALH